eukprot:4974559-Pleurochrysis_carterae.AAC.1
MLIRAHIKPRSHMHATRNVCAFTAAIGDSRHAAALFREAAANHVRNRMPADAWRAVGLAKAQLQIAKNETIDELSEEEKLLAKLRTSEVSDSSQECALAYWEGKALMLHAEEGTDAPSGFAAVPRVPRAAQVTEVLQAALRAFKRVGDCVKFPAVSENAALEATRLAKRIAAQRTPGQGKGGGAQGMREGVKGEGEGERLRTEFANVQAWMMSCAAGQKRSRSVGDRASEGSADHRSQRSSRQHAMGAHCLPSARARSPHPKRAHTHTRAEGPVDAVGHPLTLPCTHARESTLQRTGRASSHARSCAHAGPHVLCTGWVRTHLSELLDGKRARTRSHVRLAHRRTRTWARTYCTRTLPTQRRASRRQQLWYTRSELRCLTPSHSVSCPLPDESRHASLSNTSLSFCFRFTRGCECSIGRRAQLEVVRILPRKADAITLRLKGKVASKFSDSKSASPSCLQK